MLDGQVLLAAVLAVLIVSAAVVLGYQAGRHSVKPVKLVLRGYDPDGPGEGTVEVRTSAPESAQVDAELLSESEPESERVVGLRPMSAMSVDQRLESKTVRIVIGPDLSVKPWWYGGRHVAPESRCRVPRFLAVPQATAEFPAVEDWTTGEYEVLDGVSG